MKTQEWEYLALRRVIKYVTDEAKSHYITKEIAESLQINKNAEQIVEFLKLMKIKFNDQTFKYYDKYYIIFRKPFLSQTWPSIISFQSVCRLVIYWSLKQERYIRSGSAINKKQNMKICVIYNVILHNGYNRLGGKMNLNLIKGIQIVNK
ncbi:Hypothetical_protein [Hexamita inflata]|uniref:Hypothetical_protein n=1 Tax=Hexamita inflata TaxID=28002 RepID=A0AA86UXF0_9EUKA|nr:Hypothetical protein HINF_LOCUS59489 [Hexamita inflata]